MKNETNISGARDDVYAGCNPGYRPISAMNKRPHIGIKIQQYKGKAGDFPSLGHNLSKGLGKTIEREALYEETLQLKLVVNKLRKELALLKSENVKKEQEISKKDKVIDDIVTESQQSNLCVESFEKVKDAQLITRIKKQYKALKKEFTLKCEENENLKRQLKLTKLNELNIEIKTLTEELGKVKELYIHSLQQNQIYEKQVGEMNGLQESFSKQHFIIITLQENLTKLNEELKARDAEILKQKDKSANDSNMIKKCKKEISYIQQLNEKMTKEKKEADDFLNERPAYEKKLLELSEELGHYKDLANRNEKKVRELQSSMQKTSGMTTGTAMQSIHPFNYNEIKYIQENPEDKTDTKILLLKSLLQETLNKNSELEKKNKEYEEQLKRVRMESDSSGKGGNVFQSNSYGNNAAENSNEDEREIENESKNFTADQLTEFTYILIKNLEAKKITKEIAMEKIVKEIFEKVADDTKISKDDLLNQITMKVCELLKSKNKKDNAKIGIYINTLFTASDMDLQAFLEKFMSLFYNVKTYTQSEEVLLAKKIKKHLLSSQDYLLTSINKVDPGLTGYISFVNLRKLLENGQIKLKDSYIEYLIYTMKKFDEETSSLYDLKYEILFKIFNDSTHDSQMNQPSINDFDDDENNNDESGEIVITTEQYKDTINNILSQLTNLITEKKSTFRELFKNLIFSEDSPDGKGKCEVISIKLLVDELKKQKIELDTIHIYCIYNKYKIVDGFEAVSVNLVESDLEEFKKKKETQQAGVVSNEKGVASMDLEKNMEKVQEVVDEDYSGYGGFDKIDSKDSVPSKDSDKERKLENSQKNRPATSKPKISK